MPLAESGTRVQRPRWAPRSCLAVIVCAAALAAGCGGAGYACDGCNVVLISLDTLRADHVGAYGYRRPTTPNVDTLAARGTLFENAISQSSWTRPAHMSMLTGLHPFGHGFIGMADRKRLDDSVPTLARELAANGYETVAFTGGTNVSRVFGFDQGFDLFRSNGKYFRDNLEETRYWLDNRTKEKFFLFWHGYDAHTPYANDAMDRTALDVAAQRPPIPIRRVCRRADRGRIGRLVDEYDASVHHGDRFIGKLLEELERRDLLRNTIVVFTSDHGEEFLDHGGCFHVNTLYREVLHVPLIVVAPGLEPRRVAELVPGSVGIGATILDLVGIEKHGLPGPSLERALLGGRVDPGPVVSETRRRPPRGRGHLRAVTTADRKLIRWLTLDRYELFDVERDPLERSPLGDRDGAGEVGEILARWEQAHAPAAGDEHDGRGTSTASDEDLRELDRQLRGLGYAE